MRCILMAIAATALFASPALSHFSKQQQKDMQRRESSGEAASQVQRGGLKRDSRISHQIFRAERHPHDRTATLKEKSQN